MHENSAHSLRPKYRSHFPLLAASTDLALLLKFFWQKHGRRGWWRLIMVAITSLKSKWFALVGYILVLFRKKSDPFSTFQCVEDEHWLLELSQWMMIRIPCGIHRWSPSSVSLSWRNFVDVDVRSMDPHLQRIWRYLPGDTIKCTSTTVATES